MNSLCRGWSRVDNLCKVGLAENIALRKSSFEGLPVMLLEGGDIKQTSLEAVQTFSRSQLLYQLGPQLSFVLYKKALREDNTTIRGELFDRHSHCEIKFGY